MEIDFKNNEKQSAKSKLTDELFNKYWSDGKKIKEIAELTGYNEGYIYKIKKRILSQK